MLPYNSITTSVYIELDGEPYEVLDSHIFRKQQRKAVNQTKLRNLVTGNVVERTFQQSDKVEQAEITISPALFIYSKNTPAQSETEYWFHTKDDPSNRFPILERTAGNGAMYLTEGVEVEILSYNETLIGIRVPIKVDLEVIDAPPSIKGNTAQGGSKRVTLSSGARVDVPMFIEAGDIVRVNTKTGQYDTRVEKSK